MSVLSSTYVAINISIAGVDCEQEAEVKYIYAKASRGYREPGGGQIDPDEPERAEIQSVRVSGGELDANGKAPMFDITHLLTEKQMEAIETEVLEQGA